MANKITINGSNLLNNVAQDWGGTNNTQSDQSIYGTTVPPGYEWGMNHGEVERFIKSKFTEASADVGYYVCNTAAATVAKTVSASGYVLSAGGNIRIKMTNANTALNATLNINSTGAKALFYNGSQATSENSWQAGEVIVVYYDGTRYQSTNSLGGAGSSVVADEEDLTIARVNNASVMKLKDKEYLPAQYSGLGRVYLRKNIQTVDAVTEIHRTPITIPNSYSYLIDLENHVCDYTDASNRFSSRSISWEADVNEGDVFEIFGSSMTSAYDLDKYQRWRLWMMVDPTTKKILQDGEGNYLMSEAGVNHEGDGVTITVPTDCHLIVSFWTGLTSGGIHVLNRITTTSVQRTVNLFDSSLCTEQNTRYIIQYDYDLNGGQVSLPKGSVLVFDGGSIRNESAFTATIVGDDASIDADMSQVFSTNLSLSGTWRNEMYFPEWFGAKGDSTTDDTLALQAALNLGNTISVPLNVTIKLNKTYLFSDTLIVYANTTIHGNAIMSSGNSFKGYTLRAVFSDPYKCAIMSANMADRAYNAGGDRRSVDGGSIKYCDGIRILNIVMQGERTSITQDGSTVQMPIFCGIKIVASSLSSIKDSCIRGFWYGIARFATWYSSDEDIFVSAYKCGYYAGYDMNNFSIRNGYINANNNTGITVTNAEKFATDPTSDKTYGVLTVYSCGSLYNVISEGANYGRYYSAHSWIVDVHSWMEQIKDYCYNVRTGARLTIIEGFFLGDSFLDSYDSTNVKLIGMMPPGRVRIGKYDSFEVDYNGSRQMMYAGMDGRCGTSVYDAGAKRRYWWSKHNFYGNPDGFNEQSAYEGTVSELPIDFNLRPGSIFMKTEADGTVRPLFQKTAGRRCKFWIIVSTLPSSNGNVRVKFLNFEINVSVTTTSTKESILMSIQNAIISGSKDVNNVKINNTFAAFESHGNLEVIYNVAGVHTGDEFGFIDTDNTGTEITFSIMDWGYLPTFVDAMGKDASVDIVCDTLPENVPNGSSVLWRGKMVYYNNDDWYSFDGEKIFYNFLLTNGNTENSVSTSGGTVSFTVKSTYRGSVDNVIAVDDYETESTVTNGGSGTFTVSVVVAPNKLTSERTQKVVLKQLTTNEEIELMFTQPAAEEKSNIVFADSSFKNELVSRYDTDGDGEISYDEASVPNATVGGMFSGEGITSVEEFKYLINIKTLSNEVFAGNPITHFVGTNITLVEHRPYFKKDTSLEYVYFPKAEGTSTGTQWSTGQFAGCSNLIGVRYDNITGLGNEFYNTNAQFLILLSDTVVKITSTLNYPTKIYVRDALLEQYKKSDVWDSIKNNIYPVSRFVSDFPDTPSYMTKGLSSFYVEETAEVEPSTSGTYDSRPTSGIDVGFRYFATDLGTSGKPIWYTGSTWVDATGEEISVL